MAFLGSFEDFIGSSDAFIGTSEAFLGCSDAFLGRSEAVLSGCGGDGRTGRSRRKGHAQFARAKVVRVRTSRLVARAPLKLDPRVGPADQSRRRTAGLRDGYLPRGSVRLSQSRPPSGSSRSRSRPGLRGC